MFCARLAARSRAPKEDEALIPSSWNCCDDQTGRERVGRLNPERAAALMLSEVTWLLEEPLWNSLAVALMTSVSDRFALRRWQLFAFVNLLGDRSGHLRD